MTSNTPKNEDEVWELRAPGLDMVDVEEIGDRILSRLEAEREQAKLLREEQMKKNLDSIQEKIEQKRALELLNHQISENPGAPGAVRQSPEDLRKEIQEALSTLDVNNAT